MYSKFPFSMENIPRQKSFVGLSLKFGCILTALVIILYTVLALAHCLAVLTGLSPRLTPLANEGMTTYGVLVGVTITHSITFTLTSFMLVGILREKPTLIRPWLLWTSVQVTLCMLMFIFWTTMNMINHFADNSLLVYVVDFLGLLVRFYMLVLVASYHKQLEEEQYEGEKLKSLFTKEMWYSSA